MKKTKKLWIPIVAVALVVIVAAGFLLNPLMPKKEVAVFPVTMVGYTDYYSGTSESYGIVTTDKVQSLYLSNTQTVTEILVYPGQHVQKGDVLFTYDTTLSDLAIERKDLANQQLEVELKSAQEELAALKKMKPIVYNPGSSSSSKTDYTKSPAERNKLNTVYSTKTTGKSAASPLYMWIQTNKQVDNELIEYLFSFVGNGSNYVYVVFQMSSGNRADTEFSVHSGVKFTRVYEPVPTDPTDPEVPTDPSEPSESTEPTEPSESTEPTAPSESTEPSEPVTEPSTEPSESTEPTTEPTTPSESTEPTEPSESAGEESGENPGEVPADNPTPAQERAITGFTMTFFDPPSAPDEGSSNVQWNDGFTSAELTAMKAEKQAQIKQLQFDIKMGKAELNIMKKEAQDGKVLADFSGVVSEVLEPAVAMESGEPLMKVTGGGGYYVEGTISELALDTIQVGQYVTVNSWDTGTVYTGKIVELGTYPVEDQGYYYGSSNVSFYPYKVFIDESADLQEGFYVSLTYQTEAQAAGILYLQNAFLRSEGNRSYVYVRNEEGLLEKRYLECGVSTDGYMTPIYAGITEEDYLAFPYGKESTEGSPTYEGTDQDLYGY